MIRILCDLEWLHIFYSCIISDIARNIKIFGNSALNHFEKRVLNYWNKLSEADLNKLSTMSGSVSAKVFFHISWNNAVYDMVLLLQFLVPHLPSVEPNFNTKTVFPVMGRHLYIESPILQYKRNVCTCFAYTRQFCFDLNMFAFAMLRDLSIFHQSCSMRSSDEQTVIKHDGSQEERGQMLDLVVSRVLADDLSSLVIASTSYGCDDIISYIFHRADKVLA